MRKTPPTTTSSSTTASSGVKVVEDQVVVRLEHRDEKDWIAVRGQWAESMGE